MMFLTRKRRVSQVWAFTGSMLIYLPGASVVLGHP